MNAVRPQSSATQGVFTPDVIGAIVGLAIGYFASVFLRAHFTGDQNFIVITVAVVVSAILLGVIPPWYELRKQQPKIAVAEAAGTALFLFAVTYALV